jgi:hypothetical protein
VEKLKLKSHTKVTKTPIGELPIIPRCLTQRNVVSLMFAEESALKKYFKIWNMPDEISSSLLTERKIEKHAREG